MPVLPHGNVAKRTYTPLYVAQRRKCLLTGEVAAESGFVEGGVIVTKREDNHIYERIKDDIDRKGCVCARSGPTNQSCAKAHIMPESN